MKIADETTGRKPRKRYHPDPVCYTMNDAARRIGTDASVLKRAIAEGQIVPRYFFGEGYAHFLEDDLIDFVRSQPAEKTG